jgi:hypothetical protein
MLGRVLDSVEKAIMRVCYYGLDGKMHVHAWRFF